MPIRSVSERHILQFFVRKRRYVTQIVKFQICAHKSFISAIFPSFIEFPSPKYEQTMKTLPMCYQDFGAATNWKYVFHNRKSLHKFKMCYQTEKMRYQSFSSALQNHCTAMILKSGFSGKGLDNGRLGKKVRNFFEKMAKFKTFASEKFLKGGNNPP